MSVCVHVSNVRSTVDTALHGSSGANNLFVIRSIFKVVLYLVVLLIG